MRITRRHLQVSLAVLWLLDGVLQCQPVMFTRDFARQTLVPSLDQLPGVLAQPLHLVTTVVTAQPVLSNAGFALIQIALGVGLLTRRHTRVWLVGSILWATMVWMVGEGLGSMTSGATLLDGAPGAALLYAVIAVLAWPVRRTNNDDDRPSRWAIPAWCALWLTGAALQLVAGNNSAMSFTMMMRNAQSGSPQWIGSIDRHLARLHLPGWVAAVMVALDVLVAMWALVPGWTRRYSLGIGTVIALSGWLLFEGLGNLTSGQSTDPNSGPLIALLALAVVGASRPRPDVAAVAADTSDLDAPLIPHEDSRASSVTNEELAHQVTSSP